MFSLLQNIYIDYNFVIILAIVALVVLAAAHGKFEVSFAILFATFFYKNLAFMLVSSIEPWKLSVFGIVGATLIVRSKTLNNLLRTPRAAKFIYAWSAYAILMSVVVSLFLATQPGSKTNYAGFLNNEGRILSQGAYYILILMLFITPIVSLRSIQSIYSAVRAGVYGIILLAILGLAQYGIYHGSGVDIFPINRAGEYEKNIAILNNMYVSDIVRIGSLAGEPKHLAIALVFGIAIIIFGIKHSFLSAKKYIYFVGLMLIALYFTYSTTGFALMAIILLVATVGEGNLRKRTKTVTFAAIVGSIASLLVWSLGDRSALTFVVERTGLEVQDDSVYMALVNNPFIALFGAGAGNIHHFSGDYLPHDFPLFKDKAYKPNSGILFVIADSGFIGLLVLSSAVFLLIKNARRSCSNLTPLEPIKRNTLMFLSDLLLVSFALFLARYTEMLFLVLGLLCSALILVKKESANTYR